MKSNLAFFIGLFGALLISWSAIVLGSNAQLGSLAPYYDDTEGGSFPPWMPGIAARGQLVYRDLGCAACHTQQVRRPGFGSDQERGWGDRQSVARDYIYQPAPQLGLSRIGPDLTNIGGRKPTAPDTDDLLHLLYAGSGGMPSYRFLFETRRIGSGAQPASDALNLVGTLAPKPGWEVVPTPRAEALAGYLVNLKTTYDYPESVPVAPPKGEGAAPAKAPAAVPAAVPAKAPATGGAPAPAAPGAPAPAAATPTPTGAAAPAAGATPPAPAAGGAPTPTPAGGSTPAATAPTPTGTAAPAAGSAAPTPSPTGTAAAGTPANSEASQ